MPGADTLRFPAFKEWQVIISALERGRQTLLLRKGGIAEGKGGFTVKAGRFWLFPTHFHAQQAKTLAEAHPWFKALEDPQHVFLTSFAEVVETKFIDQAQELARLRPFHVWTDDAVKEKFEWSQPPGVTALVVRVHRLEEPLCLPMTADMGGCKSWIELPASFDERPSKPVLDSERFTSLCRDLGLANNSR